MSESYRKRTVGWVAGVVVVAAVAGVTGCSKETESDSGSKPAASGSSSSAASQPPKSSATRQDTAEGAVAAWVTAVIKGKPKEACLVMAKPAKGSSPAEVGTPSRCNGNSPDVQQMRESAKRFRASFTPKQSSGDPKVDVSKVPATGDKVMVPAEKINVDGQTLDKVMLSNSTGLKKLGVKVESTKVDDAWYVTNFDMNIG